VSHGALTRRDFAAALGVVLIWGTNFIAMKYALLELTPFQLGAARYLFAALPLLLVVRPPQMAWRWVVLYGLLQGVCQFGFLFLSLRIGMSAALASVLMQTQVFFTALLGYVLLGEKVNRVLRGALLLAALGLACFGANYLAPGGAATGTTAFGLLLCLGAAVMWAGSNIVVRRAQQATPQFDVVPFMVWSSLVPIIPFMLLSLAFDPPSAQEVWGHASCSTWLSLAYLGWFATILAYALWTGLLKRHPVNRVAPFSLGVPLVGVATGMLVLGDVISGWQWAGIVFVAAALAMVMFGARIVKWRSA
jgi:O-acetylserine/cysteine efflux transporter